jgi:hypothetical protein
VRRCLDDSSNGDDLDRQTLHHEMRLLGCLARANLRDEVADLRAKIALLQDSADSEVLARDVRQAVTRVVTEVRTLLTEVRAERPRFLLAKRPPWMRELFEYLDEYLSISTESYFTALVERIDADADLAGTLAASRAALTEVIVAEQEHRNAAQYSSVLHPGAVGGSYVYRKSALKKFMSSVLFLEIRKQREGRGIANVIAGIAAAVAMLFSTVAAIWSQGAYGINSFPFVVAIVISYVFKDRIKEWLRTYISHKLTRRLFDHSVQIHDPLADVDVGRCRESFGFPPPREIPHWVLRMRHGDSDSVLEPESKPEVVMRYVKDVTLRGKEIANVHRRRGDINDIIRFNVSAFLVRMDQPVQTVAAFDRVADQVRRLPCPKQYHVNVVMALHAEGKRVSVDRFRIILDKQGIRQLQQVEVMA